MLQVVCIYYFYVNQRQIIIIFNLFDVVMVYLFGIIFVYKLIIA